MELITWDIYEIKATEPLIGVRCRGRLRQFAISQNINLLTENASDRENTVRFAVLENSDVTPINEYLNSSFSGVELIKVSTTKNPVLSKLLINNTERYTR